MKITLAMVKSISCWYYQHCLVASVTKSQLSTIVKSKTNIKDGILEAKGPFSKTVRHLPQFLLCHSNTSSSGIYTSFEYLAITYVQIQCYSKCILLDMYVHMYIRTYVCTYYIIYVYACTYICTQIRLHILYVDMSVHIVNTCTYIRTCVCNSVSQCTLVILSHPPLYFRSSLL